jgi:ParB-like chromosome segregation protein Spo0J
VRELRRSLRVKLLSPDDIVPHEEVVDARVSGLARDIMFAGVLIRPIIVDSETGLLIDGHHRLAALRRLGARTIPAVLIDYLTDVGKVVIRRPEALRQRSVGEQVFKGAALSWLRESLLSINELLPPKTTFHITWTKWVRRPYKLSYLR